MRMAEDKSLETNWKKEVAGFKALDINVPPFDKSLRGVGASVIVNIQKRTTKVNEMSYN